MAKRSSPPGVTDAEVQALLARYQCPVPFHEVRTRFLGNIATPDMNASPIKSVESLWGGKLPQFDTIDAANELIGALMMGLWNRLSRHQQRSAPFRLTRRTIPTTRDGLALLASMRLQELDGFIEGLFGSKDTLNLPERAHRPLPSRLARRRNTSGGTSPRIGRAAGMRLSFCITLQPKESQSLTFHNNPA